MNNRGRKGGLRDLIVLKIYHVELKRVSTGVLRGVSVDFFWCTCTRFS